MHATCPMQLIIGRTRSWFAGFMRQISGSLGRS